jgi:hypothetical protein
MAGLDQVKGPHWSQILALYGPKGQISEILKDRNQVQLKDKARNLKLFFLKSNIEVPYYLQCVTGELKTRAPSQAARKEAEERARIASDEEQARFNGIMALAGGMQENHGHATQQGGYQPQSGYTQPHPPQHNPHVPPSNDGLSRDDMSHQHPSREGSGYPSHGHDMANNGEQSHHASQHGTPQGTQTPGGQSAEEMSHKEFEDNLGARLMESLGRERSQELERKMEADAQAQAQQQGKAPEGQQGVAAQ